MPRLIDVIVKDTQQQPVGGALVVWWDQTGRSDARASDGGGYVNFGSLSSGGITYAVWAEGYRNVTGYITSEDGHLVVQVTPSTASFNTDESGFIRTQGNGFIRDDGSPWFLAGLSMHTLIANVARGEDCAQQLDYMASVGANTALVILTHLSQWKIDNGFFYDSRRADHEALVGRLCDLFAARKKRLLLYALADAQGLSLAEKQSIWARTARAVKGRWNAMLGKCNETAVNGVREDELDNRPDVGGVLLCQGSNGGGAPFLPALDFLVWETRISPIHKMVDDAGAGVLEMQAGYSGFPAQDKPIVVGETGIFYSANPDPFGDFRYTDPALAGRLGVNTGANAQGGCFGTTNSLIARPLNAVEDACTRAWFKGAWAGWTR